MIERLNPTLEDRAKAKARLEAVKSLKHRWDNPIKRLSGGFFWACFDREIEYTATSPDPQGQAGGQEEK